MTRKALAISLLLLFVSSVSAQNSKDIVAKAGDVTISKEEFQKRFELSPHPRKGKNFDSVAVKLDFLKTLVAEKLLAQSAIKQELNKSDEYLNSMNYMRGFYLRDALYKIEVKDKVVVPDSEYAKARKKINKTLTLKFLFSTDKNEIDTLYNQINSGASFDSILSTRPEKDEQKEAAEVEFGKMNEVMEEVIFHSAPGKITKPIELKEGWYICKIYSVTSKGSLEDKDIQKIERILKDRWENKLYESFYKKFFKGVVVNVDRDLFDRLSDEINKFLTSYKESLVKKNNKFTIVDFEINLIRHNLSDSELGSIFIKFENNPVTLNSFMNYMTMEGFDFLRVDNKYLRSRLNTYVFTFIQNEILIREALKRDYDKLPDVAEDLKQWSDNYLSNLVMKKYFKAIDISDDEAYDFFVKSNQIVPQPDEVKVAEILTDNLDTVKSILDDLDKGKDFKELAKQHTIRDSLKAKGGEYDYMPVNKEGEIWKTAATLKIGEVYGPIKLSEGFAIIKLIDKRKGKQNLYESFDQAKQGIKNILKSGKMYKQLEDITAKLALDNGIEINKKILDGIKVNTINMIVFRRFGFGGQQLAVPYQNEFSNWYKKYEELKKSLSF